MSNTMAEMPAKFLVIAGEKSGDSHAASLVKSLQQESLKVDLVGIGGDQLAATGIRIAYRFAAFSPMGIFELIPSLVRIIKLLSALKQVISKEKPSVLILVDYSSINLILAKFASKQAIPVVYYIAPKVWAWKSFRLARMKQDIDQLLVILPFEEQFFKSKKLNAEYIGNPVLDNVRNHSFDLDFKVSDGSFHVAVLPGSRKQEIIAVRDTIISLAKEKKAYQFIIAGISELEGSIYEPFVDEDNVKVVFDRTYEALKECHASIVVSGTATLEACLLNSPQIVIYKTSWLSYTLVKRLIKVKFISLVNLIANENLVVELIQNNCTPTKIAVELDDILSSMTRAATILEGYQKVREQLGYRNASKTAARSILAFSESTMRLSAC